MALGGVLEMGKSRTMSSTDNPIPPTSGSSSVTIVTIHIANREVQGRFKGGVITPESSRCEWDEVGKSIAASLLPPPSVLEIDI